MVQQERYVSVLIATYGNWFHQKRPWLMIDQHIVDHESHLTEYAVCDYVFRDDGIMRSFNARFDVFSMSIGKN